MSKHVVSLVYRKKIGSVMRKAVFSYMADRANDDGTGIWSSKGTIANEIEASRQGVINTIKGLIEDGLLIEVGKRKCSNGYTIEYKIDLGKLQELPPSTCKKVDVSKSRRVNKVDRAPSTGLTPPVNDVDTNRPEPSKEPSKPARGKTHIPSDWAPTEKHERKAKLELKFTDTQYDEAIEDFIVYWKNETGQNGKKASWDRTFSTRLRDLAARWSTERNPKRNDLGSSKRRSSGSGAKPTGATLPDGRDEFIETETGKRFAYADYSDAHPNGREYLDGEANDAAVPFDAGNRKLGEDPAARNAQEDLPSVQPQSKEEIGTLFVGNG